MGYKPPVLCTIVSTLMLTVILQPFYVVRAASADPAISAELADLPQVDFEKVLQHVQFFSGLPSRVLGYDGFYDAADYIKGYWSSLGLEVREELFHIATPIVQRSSLTVQKTNGQKVQVGAYPLWPNHINPSPYTSPEEGDRLIHVDRGLPEDFGDVDPEGAFVLMDFNNRWYWKNAATFGAQGVVFLEPEETTGVQSIQKMFSIPINFPRLYVTGEAALTLKEQVLQQGEARIWVDSLMTWESREVANVVAVIEGTDEALKSQVAVIGAYYDSWSAVPELSPGATDSMGIAFLLELSRLLNETPPQRTVWLVAFAGHYQGLAGAREFVENHFNELEIKLKMMLTVDLTSDSDILAVYAAGSMYEYNRPQDFIRYYNRWTRSIFEEWLPVLEERWGETAHMIDGVQWARPSWIAASPPFEPSMRYFEAEVFTEACYGGGLGFVTTNTFRVYQHTPFNTFDRIQPENLRRQVIFLWPILYQSANMDVYYPLYPRRAGAIDHGLVTTTIQLAQYNKTTDWFDDFAHEDAVFLISVGPRMNPVGSIVAAGFSPAGAMGPSKSLVVQGVTAGLFAAPPIVGSGGTVTSGTLGSPLGFTTIMKPDADGKIVLKGIKPLTGIDAQAYVLDPETGRIISATDTGPFGTGKIRLGTLFGAASSAAAPTLTPGMGGTSYLRGTGRTARAFVVNVAHMKRDVPIFNVSSIALLGFFEPWRITDPQGLLVEVYNFLSHSYYIWRDTLEPWPEAMAFVQPDSASEILVRSSQNRIVAVLNNASEEHPGGQGYWLKHGETLILTVFDAAANAFFLANLRGGFLMAKMSSNPKLVMYLERMYGLRQQAEEASNNGHKGELYSYSVAFWQYALQTYSASFVLLADVIRTATFFFFLSAAFVLFLERLVTRRKTGMKRMLLIVGLFLATNIAMSLVHPGYVISSNIWMLINGLSVVLFSFLLFYVVTDEFNTAMKSISKSLLGTHRSDIERGSLVVSALSMGVENLKKRPVRTALALSTIAITISAMTLFTTMGVMIQSYRKPLGTPPYTGILLKRPIREAINTPISELYLWAVRDVAAEGLGELQRNPRAWVYPAGQSMFLVWGAEHSGIRSLLAITAEEAAKLEGAIEPGQGVTFPAGITKAVLISETLAAGLGEDLGVEVEPGMKISLYGIPMTVMGILDNQIASALLAQDLDQTFISPPDPLATSMTGVPTAINVTALIIVPYEFAMEYFNVQPNAISLAAESADFEEEELWKRSFDLVLTLPFDISYGIEEKNVADTATTRDIYSLSGAENMIVPLFLSSLTLLSMMLSSVYERTREITTLSTVGLSPRHIGAIFVMESIALAFLGSFLGYIVGAGVTSVLWNLELFPTGLVPNVSSGVVIIVMATMMAATILSSVYPMVKASRLATPSLLRKWRIGSKPVGGRWSVGLPFNATPQESLSVLEFIGEFLEASASERTGLFMLLEPVQHGQEAQTRLLGARLQLSPFDAGIIQDFQVVCRPMAGDRYGFEILLTRVEGVESLWIAGNKALLNEMRKQFLFWRALDPIEKERYIEKAGKRWASK